MIIAVVFCVRDRSGILYGASLSHKDRAYSPAVPQRRGGREMPGKITHKKARAAVATRALNFI